MEILLIIVLTLLIYLFNINMFNMLMFIFILLFLLLNKINFMSWWDINLYFGLNNYNLGLMILSMFILSIIIMNLSDNKCNNLIMMMFIFMLLNFLSMNMLLYYFMYESSLIMIYYLIINWSQSVFKLLASYMLIFYTLLFSLPMLLIIILIMMNNFSLSFLILEYNFMILSNFMVIYLMMGFLVKIPMYLFHGWLLKAHVEAPYFGSMILAAVMLKLGGYGLLRILMLIQMKIYYNFLIMLNILGMLIMSMLCLQQIDMKLLIAISSVVHMGLMISSMMVSNKFSFEGSYLMMVSHGFCSSGLFYLVNEIYKNSKTRLMILNKGIMMFMPIITMMWFLMCISNSAAPLSMNLFSEIFLLSSLLMYWKFLMMFLILYCLLSFMYSIYLFSMIQHGLFDIYSYYFNSGKLMGFFSIMMHWFPLNLFFMFMLMV